MRAATSSMDSTWRREDDSRGLLLAAPVLVADAAPAFCDDADGKEEDEARLGVAGLLPTRLTGFQAFEEDSETRVRNRSRASSRAESHCAFDFWRESASSIVEGRMRVLEPDGRVGCFVPIE